MSQPRHVAELIDELYRNETGQPAETSRRALGAHLVGQDLVIHGVKCVLVLQLKEILELLKRDVDLWRRAVGRGKYQRRGEATARRIERYGPGGPADG